MLRQGNCVRLFEDVTTGDLECRAGESLLIRRIEAFQDNGDTDIIAKTERVTVGTYRVQGKGGGHLDSYKSNHHEFNIMKFLESVGVNVALPVAEGQVFSWTSDVAINAVMVIFDRYDAGDISKTMPNGSESKEYVFMQYMNVGTALTASGDALFDTSLSPAEFPDFPCGKVVPARHKITLLGLIGCPWCDGQTTGKGFYTTHVKLIKDREVLFDVDRNGIPFKAGRTSGDVLRYSIDYTLIGAGQQSTFGLHAPTGKPLMFDPPLEFVAGEELNVYGVCVAYGSSPGWTTTVPDLAAILKVVKE